MTIDEAIKILSSNLIPNYPYAIGPKARALELAIEALKWVKLNRYADFPHHIPLLSGETEVLERG